MPTKPKLGLSLMPTEDFEQATVSLFQNNQVHAIEWSFDFAWNSAVVSEWCEGILDEFSDKGALTGHGVNLSPLSARFSKRQEQWLEFAKEEFRSRKYVHQSILVFPKQDQSLMAHH